MLLVNNPVLRAAMLQAIQDTPGMDVNQIMACIPTESRASVPGTLTNLAEQLSVSREKSREGNPLTTRKRYVYSITGKGMADLRQARDRVAQIEQKTLSRAAMAGVAEPGTGAGTPASLAMPLRDVLAQVADLIAELVAGKVADKLIAASVSRDEGSIPVVAPSVVATPQSDGIANVEMDYTLDRVANAPRAIPKPTPAAKQPKPPVNASAAGVQMRMDGSGLHVANK